MATAREVLAVREDFLDTRAIASQDDWKAIRIDEKADKKLTVDQVSTSACKRRTSHLNVLSSWRHFCICPCNPDIQTERNCIGHVLGFSVWVIRVLGCRV